MIKLAAYFTGFSSKADGSASLRFSTQELTGEDFAIFKNTQNQFGWLVFSENEVDLKEVPKEDADEGNKTPSKRLRNTLFVYWKQQGENGDFESFYREKMEKFINRVKAELD